MLAKTLLILSAIVYVNCQYIFPGSPSCGCNAPLMNPSLSFNGLVDLLAPIASPSCGCKSSVPAALPAALAQLILQKEALAAPKCGCSAALSNALFERILAPAAPVIPEIVMSSPLSLTAPAYGYAGPCGCRQEVVMPSLPIGCTNPFLPASSPISAMAPQIVSPLLPSVCPSENKCIYLRKIPIPPPVL